MSQGTWAGGRVSDELWRELAPEAGRLPDDERRAFRRAVGGVAAALAMAVLVWWLGVFSPHLGHGNSSGSTADASRHTAEYEFDLQNRGILPVTVSGAQAQVPGVTVTGTSPAKLRIGAGSSAHVKLAVRVDSCTTALQSVRELEPGSEPGSEPGTQSGTEPGIRVAVLRPWGTVHATVHPPGSDWFSYLVLYACGQEPTG